MFMCECSQATRIKNEKSNMLLVHIMLPRVVHVASLFDISTMHFVPLTQSRHTQSTPLESPYPSREAPPIVVIAAALLTFLNAATVAITLAISTIATAASAAISRKKHDLQTCYHTAVLTTNKHAPNCTRNLFQSYSS